MFGARASRQSGNGVLRRDGCGPRRSGSFCTMRSLLLVRQPWLNRDAAEHGGFQLVKFTSWPCRLTQTQNRPLPFFGAGASLTMMTLHHIVSRCKTLTAIAWAGTSWLRLLEPPPNQPPKLALSCPSRSG